MTQRSFGRGGGIIAAKSCFMPVKWLVPVNRNMITNPPRPATLQEDSRVTPSNPNPRRKREETRRTNKDTMGVYSFSQIATRAAYSASERGRIPQTSEV